jgi:hypothetical protein
MVGGGRDLHPWLKKAKETEREETLTIVKYPGV